MHETTRTRTVTWADPLAAHADANTMPGLAALQAMIDGHIPPPPIAVLLDLRLERVAEGLAVFTTRPAEYHYNPGGMVHGGLLAALMDSALACAVQTTLPAGQACVTVQLNLHLTRAVDAGTGELTCEARILHRGRQQATADATVLDAAGRLYCHGSATCTILTQPPPHG
jgi:uncharacterized protein (TIGR00369 family)